jgi:hypothetical protein
LHCVPQTDLKQLQRCALTAIPWSHAEAKTLLQLCSATSDLVQSQGKDSNLLMVTTDFTRAFEGGLEVGTE